MRRVLAVLTTAGALAFCARSGAESLEESCRFAQGLGDRLHFPDLGLKYLQSVKDRGGVKEGQEAVYGHAVLSLMETQARQEPDQAQKEALLQGAKELAQPALDRCAPPAAGQPKRRPLSPEEYGLAFAYLRAVQAVAKGAGADAGPRLKQVHENAGQVYQSLEAATFNDPDLKLQLMVECRMVDGASVLAMRSAVGLPGKDVLEALQQGVEIFKWVRDAYEQDNKETVGFPSALLGLAQCYRGIADKSSDAAGVKQAQDQARQVLNAVLNNPINGEISDAEANEARYAAAKELVDIALKSSNMAEAANAVAGYKSKAKGRPDMMDRAALLGARVDKENADQLGKSGNPKAGELKAKALSAATAVKDRGGASAAEAETLLSEWEGSTGRSQKNWKAEADEALKAKNYDEAVRKYRAFLRTAGAGHDEVLAKAWAGIGEAYGEEQRYLEAALSFDRACRVCPAGPRAGFCAGLAVGYLNKYLAESAKESPGEAAAQQKTLFMQLAGFPDHPAAPAAAHSLALILREEKDLAGAEHYLQGIKPSYANYAEVLYALGMCRVEMLHKLEHADKKDPKDVQAASRSAEEALAAFMEQGKDKPPLKHCVEDAAYRRIEINALVQPDKALGLLGGYVAAYPEAKDQIADLPRLRAIAQAAKGDWAAAVKSWGEAVQAVGDTKNKKWPLIGSARLLQRLAQAKKGDKDADALALTLENQLGRFEDFKFKPAADRFVDNLKQKRYADAIIVGEQILEHMAGNPAAEVPDIRKWLDWMKGSLPECYMETRAWAKAADLLVVQQKDEIIKNPKLRFKEGEVPPPLPAELRHLWEQTAQACTRSAEQMPAGPPRKEVAARASESWRWLMVSVGNDDPHYWPMQMDAFKAEVLAGNYAAARDFLHANFITYHDLGGQRDRFIDAVKTLMQKEPGFAEPYARKLLEEMQ